MRLLLYIFLSFEILIVKIERKYISFLNETCYFGVLLAHRLLFYQNELLNKLADLIIFEGGDIKKFIANKSRIKQFHKN
jgi:hypothetical protein